MKFTLHRLFGKGQDDTARTLYLAAVAQARAESFYARLGVADTVDGRFDMIAVHMFLLLTRLKDLGTEGPAVGQAMFDLMFADMDRSLREMGVGDMSVGKQVKRMISAFYGRMAAYEGARNGGAAALEEALVRNLYRGQPPGAREVTAMARYMVDQIARLEAYDLDKLKTRPGPFGPPPDPDLPTHASDD